MLHDPSCRAESGVDTFASRGKYIALKVESAEANIPLGHNQRCPLGHNQRWVPFGSQPAVPFGSQAAMGALWLTTSGALWVATSGALWLTDDRNARKSTRMYSSVPILLFEASLAQMMRANPSMSVPILLSEDSVAQKVRATRPCVQPPLFNTFGYPWVTDNRSLHRMLSSFFTEPR